MHVCVLWKSPEPRQSKDSGWGVNGWLWDLGVKTLLAAGGSEREDLGVKTSLAAGGSEREDLEPCPG